MRRVACSLIALAILLPVGASAATADDPFFAAGYQWGMGVIRAEAAWTVSKGKGAVVAVVDTGVDVEHPDLQGRLVPGADFVDSSDGSDEPIDENGHGTLVAGLVAATTFNGVGVASVAPDAKVMPVRVLDETGTGRTEDVAAGIRWAVDHGADVINLSLAQESDDGGLTDNLLRGPDVDQAIRYAALSGAIVVIAAGNDHTGARNQTSYDATVAGAIVVGAATKKDNPAAFSNYGEGLDLLAPGGGSASDPSADACKQSNSIVSTWWNPERDRSDYGGGCGTSMAVGFVSGVAALLHERGYGNAAAVRRLETTAKDLGPSGRDDHYGYGRLDAARALGARTQSPPLPVRTPAPTGTHRSGRAAKAASEPIGATPTPPAVVAPRDRVQAFLGAPQGSTPSGEPSRPIGIAFALAAIAAAGHGARVLAHARRRGA